MSGGTLLIVQYPDMALACHQMQELPVANFITEAALFKHSFGTIADRSPIPYRFNFAG